MKYELRETKIFRRWFKKSGREVQKRVLIRLARAESGNLGDHSSVGGSVSELRFRSGVGTRLYYTIRGETIILLLVGGDKSTQENDIKTAKKLVNKLGGLNHGT